MALPDDPVTLTGGCSCGAIRYRITIPEASSRPSYPMAPPDSGLRMPYPLTCHCNDCRRATASLLPPLVLQCPSPMVSVSVLSQPDDPPVKHSGRTLDVLAEDYDQAAADAQRPPYRPAMDVLRAGGEQKKKTWLRFFHSFDCGDDWSRSFCGRCGSQVCFHFALPPKFCFDGKMPEGWGDFFDIYMGTLDRSVLDKEWLEPLGEINFKLSTPFAKKVAATSKGLSHLVKMYEFTPDQGVVTEEELARLAQ